MAHDTNPSPAQLIQVGRDLEAAREGARGSLGRPAHNGTQNGGSMDPLHQLGTLGPLLAGVVGGITPDELDNATPCAGFTVRGVLEHMIGGATVFAAAYRGDEVSDPDLSRPLESFGPALQGLAAAITAPGALEQTIQGPFGAVDGETFARYVVLDGLVHGWDLAVATGSAYDPPDELVADADAFAHQIVDSLRDGQTFSGAVEPATDATPIERLAAYTGRRPLRGATP